MSSKELKTISDYARQLNHSEELDMLPISEAKKIIDVLFRCIKEDINNGIDVRLHNFGTFKLTTRSDRPERQGRNPSTGETITIPAQPEKKVITFKQSKVSK